MDGWTSIEEIKNHLSGLRKKASEEIEKATTPDEINSVKGRYLGRNDGIVTLFLRRIRIFPKAFVQSPEKKQIRSRQI